VDVDREVTARLEREHYDSDRALSEKCFQSAGKRQGVEVTASGVTRRLVG
jgi:hypothetical protein